MALFKPVKTTNTRLSSLSIKEGQLILVTDTKKLYFDISSSQRILVSGDSVVSFSVSGSTVTFTRADGTTGTFTIDAGASYTAGAGIDITNDVISNKGVRGVSEGATNGTISVNTNGTSAEVAVHGLGSLAYKSSLTAADVGAIATSDKGANSGVAELDSNGKVPTSQLPSYVDDVIEGYYYNNKFYKEEAHTTEISGEAGKIYIDLPSDKTYRWGGTSFIVISETLSLGETSTTAYRGDRGKIAYDHSQTAHARADATKVESSSTNGKIKINGSETTVYTHPSTDAVSAAAVKVGKDSSGHVVIGDALTKSDVGLSNVGNFKAVSTVASQGLSETEKSNARTNIGAGTSNLALGTSSTTAYRGDYGNTAYTHATDSNRLTTAADSGLYKIATTAEGHVKSVTAVAKADITALGIPGSDTNNRRAFYGTCSTAADTRNKEVTLADTTGWELAKGTVVGVKFTNTNTYSSTTDSPITLNVNGTGAKNIWYNNTHSGAGNTGTNTTAYGYANRILYYMYDGTYWVWMSHSIDNNNDTKNTAGSTDTSDKIFIVGAKSQAANPQTYSQDTAYVGTDGHVYSNSKQVVNLSDTQALTNKTYNGYTLAAASAKAVDTSISAASTSANLPTSQAVAAFVEGKGYTTNTGTVTKVSTGAGLTGGDVTTTGTIKANLKSETKSTLEAADMGSTANKQYAVGLDKNGKLSVNIPWTDNNTTYTLAADTTNNKITLTPSSGNAQSITVPYATGAGKATNDSDGNAINSTYLKKSGGAMTGAITRALASSGTIANTNLFTVTGSTDGFKVDYAATTADVGVTTFSTTDDANAKLSLGNTVSSTYKEAIGITNGIPTAPTATAGTNTTQIATTAFVQTAIDNLPDPMVFKGSLGTNGTITALPVDGSASVGDTYKVITAGTYASQAAKVGDTFICDSKTSSANTWVLVPSGDEPSGTVTSVTIKATSPIAIDSTSAITTSGTRTLSHANSGVTAGTYRSVTVNATGHVTAGTNPTTLSGYGITDAKIASGVITLGSNTITPLTASSTLDATKLSGTIPSSCYTDTNDKVTQTNSTTDAAYRLVLSATADDTTRTEKAVKSTNFRANPSTGALYAKGYDRIDISGQTLDINTLNLSAGSPNSMHYIEKTDGGSNNITNIPVTGKPFLLDVDVIRWAGTTDYITRQIFTNANNPNNSYVRYCTNGTWGNWTTRVYTDTNNKVTISNTNPTTGTWYYPVWYTGTSGTGGVSANDGFRHYSLQGTASAVGQTILQLGNATASGTAGNKYGELRIYAEKAGYGAIKYTASATGNTTHTLPTTGGTILNTGTTSFTQTLTEGTEIGTIKINGTSTKIYAPTGGGGGSDYVLKAGDTMTGDLLFANSGTSTRQVQFKAGDNDYGRIAAGATAANAGWLEIATADDSNEPIYVRQYSGVFTTITRTATLLDASGNTNFPNKITTGNGKIGLTSAATVQYNSTDKCIEFIFS